jgi:hypothetical protein
MNKMQGTNFGCIIPIVLQEISLSMKNAENLDAKELLEVPYNMTMCEQSRKS